MPPEFFNLLTDGISSLMGDGIIRQSVPGAARFASLSTANYWTSAVGAGGPDFNNATAAYMKWYDFNNAADGFLWGYGDGASGWGFDINALNPYWYLRNPGAAPLVMSNQGRIYGLNCFIVTRLAGGAARGGHNGCLAQQISAAPTYIAGSSSAREYVGRANPAIGSFPASNMGPIEWGYFSRALTDAELQEWSRTDQTWAFSFHPDALADASLVHRVVAADWDGTSSTLAPRIGNRTLTKTGNPTRVAIADRWLLTIPQWAFIDSARTTDTTKRAFGGRVRFVTDATELGVILSDGLGTSSGTFVAYKDLGCVLSPNDSGKGSTWVDDLNAFGANGNPVLVEVYGLSAGSKAVEIIEGLRIQSGTGPYGSVGYNATQISVPKSASFQFAAASSITVADRMLIVADSIGEQVYQAGSICPKQAWTVLVRADRGGVAIDAIGSSSYYSRCFQSAWRASTIAAWSERLDGTTRNILWLALGTNDYGINPWASNLTNFGTCVAATLDDMHAARPDVLIRVQLPITRTTEGTIEQWRQVMRDIVATRTSFCTLIETMTVALGDGLHPNIAGHATIAGNVKVIEGY